jgi:hypothetical protein
MAATDMPAWPLRGLVARLPYRVRQFLTANLAPVAPAEIEAALAQARLPEPAARLFRAMPRPYQRHALNVAARLQRGGHTDPTLLGAALLHDMGKWDPASGRKVPVVHRSIVALITWCAPGRQLLRRLVAGPPPVGSWRYPWHLQQHHPELSARLAEGAGVAPDVVALVRYHQDGAGIPARLRPTLALLQQADDQE